MKYIKGTMLYISKNFIYLLPFALAVAVCFIFQRRGVELFVVFKYLRYNELGYTFADLYRGFSFINLEVPITSIICCIVLAVCAALAMGLIEKHMRIGKRSFSGLLNGLNHNILSTLIMLLVFLASYELWAVITSSLLLLCKIVFVTAGWVFVSSALVTAGMYCVLFVFWSALSVWLPCSNIMGFNRSEALVYSIGLTQNKKRNIFLSLAFAELTANIVLIIVKIIMLEVFGISDTGGEVVDWRLLLAEPTAAHVIMMLFRALTYVYYFMYFTTLLYVIYFDVSNTTREDLKKLY